MQNIEEIIRLESGELKAVQFKESQLILVEKAEVSESIENKIKTLSKFPASTLNLPGKSGVLFDKQTLFALVKDFVKKTVKLNSEEEYSIVTAYVLLTWVWDRYPYFCYLIFTGPPGCGKSTLLHLMFHLSYRSYRGSGADTDAALIRTVDVVRGTQTIDEAQRSTQDHSSDFHKIMALGFARDAVLTKCIPTSRGDDFTMKAFQIGSPKVLAARELPGDQAISSRCIEIEMRHHDDTSFIQSLANPFSSEWLKEANELRDALLIFRLKTLQGEIA